MERSAEFILVQVTSTVGSTPEQNLCFFRHVADELGLGLDVRPDDVVVNLVFVERADWSFGSSQPW